MATVGPDAKRTVTIAVTLVFFASILATSAIVAGVLPLPAYLILPKADSHAAAARIDLARHDFQAALRQTHEELSVSPMRDAAWLRLAELDATAHGRLTPVGLNALSHAYDVAPYDLTPGGARIRFVSSHYGELSDDLRAEVDQERAALSR